MKYNIVKKLSSDDKITYKELVSQLKWLIEYFKYYPVFITNPDYNFYIQMNISLLSQKSSKYKSEFINLLKQLPEELIDLYGYQNITN